MGAFLFSVCRTYSGSTLGQRLTGNRFSTCRHNADDRVPALSGAVGRPGGGNWLRLVRWWSFHIFAINHSGPLPDTVEMSCRMALPFL
jgi:hypothetical protein